MINVLIAVTTFVMCLTLFSTIYAIVKRIPNWRVHASIRFMCFLINLGTLILLLKYTGQI